mmetsp:Transcript_27452/g.80751  ORF Transcript_27452/g.80751 Transcript_27452/m.80751 type:complete len:211 (-) Transcript_27452:823-1455(-)
MHPCGDRRAHRHGTPLRRYWSNDREHAEPRKVRPRSERGVPRHHDLGRPEQRGGGPLSDRRRPLSRRQLHGRRRIVPRPSHRIHLEGREHGEDHRELLRQVGARRPRRVGRRHEVHGILPQLSRGGREGGRARRGGAVSSPGRTARRLLGQTGMRRVPRAPADGQDRPVSDSLAGQVLARLRPDAVQSRSEEGRLRPDPRDGVRPPGPDR